MLQYVCIAIALLLLSLPTAYLRAKGYAIFRADRKKGTGVYGWLFLFVLVSLYVGPLLGLGVAVLSPQMESYSAMPPALSAYKRHIICSFMGMFFGIALSVFAGMTVVMRKPGAKTTVKRLLAARVGGEAVCYCALPFLILPHAMAIAVVNMSVTNTLAMAFIQTAWALYFNKSKQVERTFAA